MGKFTPAVLFVAIAAAQTPGPPDQKGDTVEAASSQTETYGDKHILGVVPNYTTVNEPPKKYQPISAREKFKLATEDTFDPCSLAITGIYAGVAQWGNNYRQFGQGAQGYGKRYGAAFADGAISNYLTEGVLPSLLHEDPRLFRLGTGSKLKRVVYAMTRVLITRTDSGGERFNISEIAGNMISAGLSNLYYPPLNRSLDNTLEHFEINVLSDAGFNILKEFWPDMRRKVLHKGDPEPAR
jgi:hypothetical protein